MSNPTPFNENAAPAEPFIPATTNKLAIVSLVSSFFVSIVGVITGHIALNQIKTSGEKGRGLAIGGLIVGYLSIVITILAVVLGGAAAANLADSADKAVAEPTSEPAPVATEEAIVPEEVAPVDGALSAEFCSTLEGIIESTPTDGLDPANLPPELLAGYNNLASIDSRNQDVYVAFADVINNIDDLDSVEDLPGLISDYTDAVTEDVTDCYTS